jgi:hypothetical protein
MTVLQAAGGGDVTLKKQDWDPGLVPLQDR